MSSATTFYDLEPLDSRSQPYNFSQLKGKVVLIVNVASKYVVFLAYSPESSIKFPRC